MKSHSDLHSPQNKQINNALDPISFFQNDPQLAYTKESLWKPVNLKRMIIILATSRGIWGVVKIHKTGQELGEGCFS